ncbi:hypothetical protein [Photobacterium sp. R1]
MSVILGQHQGRIEFQCERTLVWVDTSVLAIERSLEIANQDLNDVWESMSLVLSFAEKKMRELDAKLWAKLDDLSMSSEALEVWGVWYYPHTRAAHYDVNYSLTAVDFDLPEERVIVLRKTDGTLNFAENTISLT